jgi:hypothetical protein
MDYNGDLHTLVHLQNTGAFAVFGDFLYNVKMGTRVIQETNVSTGFSCRNISLPKPFTHLIDLAVIEKSQYPSGKKKLIMFICCRYAQIYIYLKFKEL